MPFSIPTKFKNALLRSKIGTLVLVIGWIVWELLSDRLVGWANEKINQESGAAMDFLAPVIRELATVELRYTLVAAIIIFLIIFIHAYYKEQKKKPAAPEDKKPNQLSVFIKKCKEQDTSWMEFNRSVEVFLPIRLNTLRQLKSNYAKYNLTNLMSLNPTMIPDSTSGETRKEVNYMLERLEANGYIVTEDSKSPKNKIKFTDKWDEL